MLFVCIHNSARSQMAEAFLNKYGNGKFIAESAGIESGVLNELVVESMKDAEIDISQNKTKSVFELTSKNYDYVITVCERDAADKCPVFPGKAKRIQLSFDDPSKLTETLDTKLLEIGKIREEIKTEVLNLINSM